MECPVGERNPRLVARRLCTDSAVCPVCGGPAVLTAEAGGAGVSAAAVCPVCGSLPVAIVPGEGGDLRLEVSGKEIFLSGCERDAPGSTDVPTVREA